MQKTDITNQIKDFMKTTGRKQIQMAKEMGVSQGYLSSVLSGDKGVSGSFLNKLLQFNLNPSWLMLGQGPMYMPESPDEWVSESNANYQVNSPIIRIPNQHHSLEERGIPLKACEPFFNKEMGFSKEWLQQQGWYLKDLLLLHAPDDSMSPTIMKKDVLLVHTHTDEPDSDGIYGILLNGHFAVRRLQRQTNDMFRLITDHSHYESETISTSQVKKLKIIGKVVWVGGLK